MKDRYQYIVDQEKNKLSQNLAEIDRRCKRNFIIISSVFTALAAAAMSLLL